MKNLRGLWKMAPALLLIGLAGCPTTATGSFQIVNAAPGVMITELYLVPSGSGTNGPNLLHAPLGLGGSVIIRNLAPGYYDELAKAVVVSSSDFVELPNREILVPGGGSYIHTVYWTSENPSAGGPSLDDVVNQP